MHQEKYSLTWETYSDHLKGLMKELMMNEDFSDITFVTEDKKQIKANINILSACSPIFKDILKKEKNSRQIMYLRGIQFSEIESILQFVYLGEATFYEERMDEFLAVAKSLEIKELCNAESKSNLELDDGSLPRNPNTADEEVKEQTVMSNHMTGQVPEERKREVLSVDVDGKYKCNQCDYQTTHKGHFTRHVESKHEGVKYACDQCDYQSTHKGDLNKHIQSQHEGVRYACVQCDYQAGYQSHLNLHIKSKHEGVKYSCTKCDHQYTHQSSLTKHIQSKHEGIKYACDQCDNQLSSKSKLARHIKTIHE